MKQALREELEIRTLNDDEQNVAISILWREAEARCKTDEDLTKAMGELTVAVKALQDQSLARGVKWSLVDKIGVTVLGVFAAIAASVTTWFLTR